MLKTLNLIIKQKSPTKFLTQKEFITFELAVILLLVVLVSNIARGTSYADTTSTENFSVMGTVNNIASTTLSLINANGSDSSGFTSYILDISKVNKIQNQNYIPLTITDINIGDTVIAQGLDTNGIFLISRIISLTAATTSDMSLSTSTASTTSDSVATGTATTTTSSSDYSNATSTNDTINPVISLTAATTSDTSLSTSTVSTTDTSVATSTATTTISTDTSSTSPATSPEPSATTTDDTSSSTLVVTPTPDTTTASTTDGTSNSTLITPPPPDSTGSTTP